MLASGDEVSCWTAGPESLLEPLPLPLPLPWPLLLAPAAHAAPGARPATEDKIAKPTRPTTPRRKRRPFTTTAPSPNPQLPVSPFPLGGHHPTNGLYRCRHANFEHPDNCLTRPYPLPGGGGSLE